MRHQVTKEALVGIAIIAFVILGLKVMNFPEALLGRLNSGLADSVQEQISELKSESTAESAEALLDINWYSWGSIDGVRRTPHQLLEHTKSTTESRNLASIMSNRRFRKVLDELSGMSKGKASEIVKRELSSAFEIYLGHYELLKLRFTDPIDIKAELAKPENKGKSAWEIDPTGGIIRTDAKGAVVMTGVRLKILSLVWISALLELDDAREEILQIVNLALEQRSELDVDEKTLAEMTSAELFFGNTVHVGALYGAGLYNRPILTHALIMLSDLDDEEIDELVGNNWIEIELPKFNTAYIENDRSLLSGLDFLKGKISVKHLPYLSNEEFDRILEELGVAER